MEKVVVADVRGRPLEEGLDEIFAAFGGVEAVASRAGKVFIKPNGIHFAPETHTAPKALAALLSYLRDHGYQPLYVMENCTHSNFTRLVFKVTGYDEVCRRYEAKALYLDERPTARITLEGEDAPVEIPRIVYTELIAEKGENSYLSLPKLKTHPMTVVTLGVKNQMGLLRRLWGVAVRVPEGISQTKVSRLAVDAGDTKSLNSPAPNMAETRKPEPASTCPGSGFLHHVSLPLGHCKGWVGIPKAMAR